MDKKNKNLRSHPHGAGPEISKAFVLNHIAQYCDKCGHKYSEGSINLVKKSPNQALIHLDCQNCGTGHLANFMHNLGVSARSPFLSDLSFEELKEFISQEAVSSDQVLDVYDFVNSEKGLSSEDLLKILKLLSKAMP